MRYNPEIHTRKTIRLNGYDYSNAGYYFITICVKDRLELLSEIVGAGLASAHVKLTDIGSIINGIYRTIPTYFTNVFLDEYVIMPNHLHLIIQIAEGSSRTPTPTIGNIISYFKSKSVCECINKLDGKTDIQFNQIWQRNYHEHIIRNEKEYYIIKQYIQYNPFNWEQDKYNK